MYGFIIAFIITIIAFIGSALSLHPQTHPQPHSQPQPQTHPQPHSQTRSHPHKGGEVPLSSSLARKEDIINTFIAQNPSKYIIVVGNVNFDFKSHIPANSNRKIIFVDHNSGIRLDPNLDLANLPPITKIRDQMTLELAEQLQMLDCILISPGKAKTDSARLIHLARQYAMFEMIKPKKALLTLRMPQYNQKRAEFIEQINRNSYKSDFEYVKDIGIDFITDYYNHSIVFYDGDIIRTRTNNYIITDGTKTKIYSEL